MSDSVFREALKQEERNFKDVTKRKRARRRKRQTTIRSKNIKKYRLKNEKKLESKKR